LPRPRFTFPSRLYAILDLERVQSLDADPLTVLAGWLRAGVRLVQLRAKSTPDSLALRLAERLTEACRLARVTAIVNDRADIAVMCGADGVHVGQDDLAPAAVRDLIGPERLLGVSTHSDAQMQAACLEPVDYVAIGPVFTTRTKRSANLDVGLSGVSRASVLAHDAGLPIVAIGGITLATAPSVLGAGADAVAVIADLLSANPEERAREYLQTI
jgi:thiamine-phosphate pyrophosphorylase